MIIGADLEWTREAVDVLGLAWDEGRSATATGRTTVTLQHYLDILRRADRVVGHSFIDADCRQLAKEGIDVSWLEPKVQDTRLCLHATHGHLAGTGSYDLRSLVLLLNGRQGERFPLDFKQYESDLYATCALDAAAGLWCSVTLNRLITSHRLEGTVAIAHKVAPIFARMREQGVKLDRPVLDTIYMDRKAKLATRIEHYGLWEERGKKVITRVPIWRSKKVLDIFEQRFGIRPKNLQRATWKKLLTDPKVSAEGREFAHVIIELGQGANDAHWLGKARETDAGLDFDKVGDNGFIYPRYDSCGSPDRATASNPNIQNFPRPSDDPRPVPLRRAVVPLDPSHVIVGVDFSSIETITNAYESDDMDRVHAVLSKRISHEGTAQTMNSAFGLSLTRQQGKAVNHAFDKGESPWNLACRIFNTERPSRQHVLQCQTMYAKMLAEYPKTAAFRDRLWERSRENPLVVANSFGRRLMCFSRSKYGDAGERYAKHAPEKKYWCTCGECAPRRDRWKYAIAFLGRSCAFDALLRKMAAIWYDQRLDQYSLPYLEVHDELDFSVPNADAERYAKRAIDCFEEPIMELNGICLPADAKWGDSWASAH
jgi:DNA polymerase I-like protein with 3'-5' exonuclease and polymerase domains